MTNEMSQVKIIKGGISLMQQIKDFYFADLKFVNICLDESKVAVSSNFVKKVQRFMDNGCEISVDREGIKAKSSTMNVLLIATGCLLVVK